MDGFLDETRSGVTELRVHGVSGTPPEGMLNHPHPWIVAGDGTTGFYRRWWTDGPPDGEHADVPDSRHREAYAWGGLTSGGKTIALWLLLLPFALANLSYFMLPRPARGTGLRHVTEAAQRLFALLLTGTLVGGVTRAGVDLVGWQCTAAGRACTYDTAPVWVHWLGALWGNEPSRRLAVTALVPLLVVVVLWWIARRTWQRDERTAVPPGGGDDTELPLARPRLWHGDAPVWRLRVVHVCFAIASIGVAVAAPFAGTPLGLALTVANAAVELAAAVLVVLPGIARRLDPGSDERIPDWLTFACRALRVLAPLACLATLGAALAGMGPGAPGRQLPGVGVGAFQFALTVGIGAFILVATCVLAWMDRASGEPRAMGGIAAWFVLMVAAGSANVLALGLLFWTATFFGVPGTSASPEPAGRKLYLDDPVWWTAALVPLLAVGFAGLAAALYAIRGSDAGRLTPELTPLYGERDGGAVAGKWALAALTDRAGLVLGVLTGIGVAGFAVVTVIYQFHLFTPNGGIVGLLATLGSWAMAAVIVGLVFLGRRTYSDSGLRRTIGILWDISTFWPRAIHPLAPPCYTERVIPELIDRVDRLVKTSQDKVVLSGHSQGSVITAALVLQLKPELRARVRMLTHGSPLRRLYAAFFPAYFGTAGLSAVRDAVPWYNLYRLSDPIGGPVFGRVDPLAPRSSPDGPPNGVDVFCWDPHRAAPGEPLPEARWHTDYWLDPEYDEALSRLIVAKPFA
ncbi:hypothetical protein [Nonomuraea jabiensis]|uniref:Putative membrane protein n=1 Tax=Nonomuraea jabiensis TaxID=882448 RepID=A0A7W9LEC1_9ACTN|nr:hypothetical protein [Nonomuraea jabiensis]MBB5780717.1 putative membrane protein [Nonomuraea jabiensis]